MKLATAIKRLEADRKAYAEWLKEDGVYGFYKGRVDSLSQWIEFRTGAPDVESWENTAMKTVRDYSKELAKQLVDGLAK